MKFETNTKTMDDIIDSAERISVLTDLIIRINCDEEQSPDNQTFFFHLAEIINKESKTIISIVQNESFTAILEKNKQEKSQIGKKAA